MSLISFQSQFHSSYPSFKPLRDSIVSQLHDHQRVRLPLPSAASPKSTRAGVHSHWDTLRRLTRQRFHQEGSFGVHSPASAGSPDVKDSPWCGIRRGSYPPSHPAAAQAPPCYKPMSNRQIGCSKPMSQCRVCYTNLLWEQSLNRSAPSVYSSVVIGKKRSVGFSSSVIAPTSFIIHHSCSCFFVDLMSVFSLETTSSKR